jgi:hypothetical protein
MAKRYRHHLWAIPPNSTTWRGNWIGSVLAAGRSVYMVELECVPSEGDWEERERYWISYFRSLYDDLTNHQDGGGGGHGWEMSEEARANISMSKRHVSDETRRKLSEALRGRKVSDESRAKMREAKKRLSDESRRRMSEGQRRRDRSTFARNSNPSEETRARMRASSRRRFERERQEWLKNGGVAPIRTNYERGKEAERKVREALEARGYYCVESRGSHGTIDVVGIGNNRLVLVQSKRTKRPTITPAMYREDIAKLRELIAKYALPVDTSVELWVWRDRIGFSRYVIEGDELVEKEAM